MALGAILGAALTDHSAHPWGLFVGGLDVIKQPITTGNGYGTPLNTIEVTENGPGGVSSITFSIDDPLLQLVINVGDEIQFWDLANDQPEFGGFVQSWSVEPDYGIGRRLIVTGIGYEAILDWAIVTSLTLVAGMNVYEAVQSVVANATAPAGLLRVGSESGRYGTQANPLGRLTVSGSLPLNTTLVLAGVTVREAIRQICADMIDGFTPASFNAQWTVDFYKGLRLYRALASAANDQPTDWAKVVVTDVAGGTKVAEDANYETDGTGVVRGVYVKGGNAAGTVLFYDGSSKPGQVVILDQPTILTAFDAFTAQEAYFAQFSVGVRGDFTLSDWTPDANAHAGGLVTYTDTMLVTSGDYRIGSIRKTYTGVRETWTISFGGMAPSAANLMRRLTRSTLS